jgi:hypothetical protein
LEAETDGSLLPFGHLFDKQHASGQRHCARPKNGDASPPIASPP